MWSPLPTANTQGAALGANPVPLAAGAEDRLSEVALRRSQRGTVDVATTAEALFALKPEYDRLSVLCGNTLPFALHEWHVAWWNHLAKTGSRVRDELRIHTVRDDRGECVAIVPFVSTRRQIGAFRTESLALLGSDPNFTEIRCPLVVPGAERLAADAVARRLDDQATWDWVDWSGIGRPFGEALDGHAPLQWRRPVLDYVLDLAPTWEAFHARLKRNIRESLRHCYNSLKRDGLTFELEVAQSRDAVRNALHLFVSLHAMRAQLTGTIAHPDRFASLTSRGFLFDVCDRLAARGVARILVLKIRGCVVAVRIAFVVGEQIYFYYSGFDPRWAKYSVSTTILAESIKYAIEQKLTAANLSTGTDVSKTRWGARLVVFAEATQPRPRLRSRAMHAAYLQLRGNSMVRQAAWLTTLRRTLPSRTLA